MKRESILAQEEELTLLIASENPESIVQAVADLTRLGRFSLIAREPRIIHDVYYDRIDGSLGAKGWAFRIREVNAARVVTLKGPPSPNEWGGVQRIEFEAQWSRDALDAVMDLMAVSGVRPPERGWTFDLSDPYATVESLGMRAIQDRETVRQVRDIVPDDHDSGSSIAELVIDSVTYHFRDIDVGHYELELEAGSPEAPRIIGDLAKLLLEMFGASLRPWNMGKTATGKRLERLLAQGIVARLMKDGKLLPAAYDHMAQR